jgi:hypothetical protein
MPGCQIPEHLIEQGFLRTGGIEPVDIKQFEKGTEIQAADYLPF